jgi:hypothetical protein
MFILRASLLCALLCSTSLLPGQEDKRNPEVAPGVTLPSTGMIYGLDNLDKKPSLLQIHPTEIHDNSHAGSNFARSMVYAGPHRTIELSGISSAATFHTTQAVFYVRLTGDDPELLRNRVKLIQLKQIRDRRIVSDFSMNVFGGQRSQHYDEVPIAKSDVPGTPWLKLVLQSPLEPGEYGIVFMPKDPSFFADAVYDFSVADDAAPQPKQ